MRLFRGRLAFMLAIIAGLVAVWAAVTIIEERSRQPAPQVEMATVVLASRDIPARTKVTPDMLVEWRLPAMAIIPDAARSIGQVEGQVTRLAISQGEQIISRKFATQRDEAGLSFALPPSRRAVSIKVNEVIGSGGNILPGDHVDIIAIFDNRTMGKDMAVTILQDIEVMAVAQSTEVTGPQPQPAPQNPMAGVIGSVPSAISPSSRPRPEARSVTVSVDTEQAQRLVLAEERGSLRLALRPYKDVAVVDVPEANLRNITSPLRQGNAQITAVSFQPTKARAGEKVKVSITVKNISTIPIKSQGPDPGFTYVQGQTFFSQNYPSKDGMYRVGVHSTAAAGVPFPYRWGLGTDLPAGSSVTIEGNIMITTAFEETDTWAGLIQEPATVLQDNVGLTKISATASGVAVIAVDVAPARAAPDISSAMIEEIPFGTELKIISQEGEWYRVLLPKSNKEGYVAAGWIASPR
jgi:pilus assembly protein CpaB